METEPSGNQWIGQFGIFANDPFLNFRPFGNRHFAVSAFWLSVFCLHPPGGNGKSRGWAAPRQNLIGSRCSTHRVQPDWLEP